MKILVVEDDFVAQSLLAGLLRAHGDVHVESSAEEASIHLEEEMMNGQKYDLICLDIGLRDEDGTSVLSRLRELEDHLDRWRSSERARVVMTTARSTGRDILGAFKKNCDGYLVKPISKDSLETELKRLQLV